MRAGCDRGGRGCRREGVRVVLDGGFCVCPSRRPRSSWLRRPLSSLSSTISHSKAGLEGSEKRERVLCAVGRKAKVLLVQLGLLAAAPPDAAPLPSCSSPWSFSAQQRRRAPFLHASGHLARPCRARSLLLLVDDLRLDLGLLDLAQQLARLGELLGLGAARARLRLEDGELLLGADQVEHERVGAREDERQDEARAVQVEVALCGRGGGESAGAEERQEKERDEASDAPLRNLRER